MAKKLRTRESIDENFELETEELFSKFQTELVRLQKMGAQPKRLRLYRSDINLVVRSLGMASLQNLSCDEFLKRLAQIKELTHQS